MSGQAVLVPFVQKIKQKLRSVLSASERARINAAVTAFTSNPQNPFLISFPRTGSHWLRMLMELYFERPSLKRTFFFHKNQNYLTLHTHDLDLSVVRLNVIYLYRNPVPTIYSQLRYHREDENDPSRVAFWTALYAQHLDKWLFKEDFTQKKTIVTYENLKSDMISTFAKICLHFGTQLEPQRLETTAQRITKTAVSKRTRHDRQVVNLDRAYQDRRERFRRVWSGYVWNVLLDQREHLAQAFPDANVNSQVVG
jgi:hypothetical protein